MAQKPKNLRFRLVTSIGISGTIIFLGKFSQIYFSEGTVDPYYLGWGIVFSLVLLISFIVRYKRSK